MVSSRLSPPRLAYLARKGSRRRLTSFPRPHRYEIGVALPTRVKMRLALAKELIELF